VEEISKMLSFRNRRDDKLGTIYGIANLEKGSFCSL
jgi:hypothetical protein